MQTSFVDGAAIFFDRTAFVLLQSLRFELPLKVLRSSRHTLKREERRTLYGFIESSFRTTRDDPPLTVVDARRRRSAWSSTHLAETHAPTRATRRPFTPRPSLPASDAAVRQQPARRPIDRSAGWPGGSVAPPRCESTRTTDITSNRTRERQTKRLLHVYAPAAVAVQVPHNYYRPSRVVVCGRPTFRTHARPLVSVPVGRLTLPCSRRQKKG